jgi:hypothetical protein
MASFLAVCHATSGANNPMAHLPQKDSVKTTPVSFESSTVFGPYLFAL